MKNDQNERRFFLTKEEKEKVGVLIRISKDLKIQHDAITDGISVELERVKRRLGLHNEKVPEGIDRVVQFDAKTFELFTIDFKSKAKKEEKEVVDSK